MLLITPFALQSVHLRSVRRKEETESYRDSEGSQTEDFAAASVSKLLEELSLECGIEHDTPDGPVVSGKPEEQSCNGIGEGQKVAPSDRCSPVKQKPPIIAKKPKFCFVLPLSSQPAQEVTPSPCEDTDGASPSHHHIQETTEEETQSSATSAEIWDECLISTNREPFQNGEARTDEDEDGASSPVDSVSSKEDDAGLSFHVIALFKLDDFETLMAGDSLV